MSRSYRKGGIYQDRTSVGSYQDCSGEWEWSRDR